MACLTGQDRFFDTIRDFIRSLVTPMVRLATIYEYEIATVTDNAYDLTPVDGTAGLPQLPDVKIKPGIGGLTVEMTVGALVYVAFVNGKSTRPFIVSVGGSDDPDFVPTSMSLDAGSVEIAPGGGTVSLSTPSLLPVGPVTGRVVRYGDLYTVGTPGSTIPLTFAGVAPISKVSA